VKSEQKLNGRALGAGLGAWRLALGAWRLGAWRLEPWRLGGSSLLAWSTFCEEGRCSEK
jgi:hypothetical protein